MPKLDDSVATKVAEAENGFEPVPAGKYVLQLKEDVEVNQGAKGPYWKWTFEIPEGYAKAGRRFFHNTSLSDAAYFKLKETFDAFGVPANTDTEDLVMKKVIADITVEPIQGGPRQGQPGNQIKTLFPFDPDAKVGPYEEDESAMAIAKSGSSDEPLF